MTSYKLISSEVINTDFIEKSLNNWRDILSVFDKKSAQYRAYQKLISEVDTLSVQKLSKDKLVIKIRQILSNSNYESDILSNNTVDLFINNNVCLIKNRNSQVEKIINYIIYINKQNQRSKSIFQDFKVSDMFEYFVDISNNQNLKIIPSRVIFHKVTFKGEDYEEINIKQKNLNLNLMNELENKADYWKAITLHIYNDEISFTLRIGKYGNLLLYGNAEEKVNCVDKLLISFISKF